LAKKRKPQSTATEAKAVRDGQGRFVPGTPSPNPGGLPKAVAQARRDALAFVPGWLERLNEISDSDDEVAAVMAIKTGLARALGREAAPHEMPDDSPLPEGLGTPSTPELLDLAKKLLGRSLRRIESKISAGEAVPDATLVALGDHLKTLKGIADEERELAKQGPAANIPDAELVAKVLAAVSLEQLEKALSARKAVAA
jgi:hypothetical protein